MPIPTEKNKLKLQQSEAENFSNLVFWLHLCDVVSFERVKPT
jgi:hypothetical protein